MSRHDHLIPQIIVIVSIDGTKQGPKVTYAYTDPGKKKPHPVTGQPKCKISAFPPYHAVYALDYASAKNGWYFRKHIVMTDNSRNLHHDRAANRLSMTTKYKAIDKGKYYFYLLFRNQLTGECLHDDPQEGNAPPPTVILSHPGKSE